MHMAIVSDGEDTGNLRAAARHLRDPSTAKPKLSVCTEEAFMYEKSSIVGKRSEWPWFMYCNGVYRNHTVTCRHKKPRNKTHHTLLYVTSPICRTWRVRPLAVVASSSCRRNHLRAESKHRPTRNDRVISVTYPNHNQNPGSQPHSTY